MSATWIFDPAAPSGARSGGNAAEYSFEGQIDTLVREVVQNSMDAVLDKQKAVRVRFRLVELSGPARKNFLDGMGWTSLVDNLVAVPKSRGGLAVNAAVEKITSEKKIRILVIEDRNTKGLEGGEQRESDGAPNSFRSLVYDELYSDKADGGAGGSFGLGKSVLWAFSGIETVLFSSVLATPPPSKSGMRLIGRAALPFHTTKEDGMCTGNGWFGIGHEPHTQTRRAESVWGEEAEELARKCGFLRSVDDLGLSAVIVGFAEPGGDDRALQELASLIKDAAMESFWPAMVRSKLEVEVRVETNGKIEIKHELNPFNEGPYLPVVQLLRDYDDGKLDIQEELQPGESGYELVDLELPKCTEEPTHSAEIAQAVVLVRVLREDECHDVTRDRVFKFRAPGMIVRSDSKSNLSITAQPYVAAVLAGRAGGSEDLHIHAESFLRAAEPPAHDQWTHATRKIKQNYQTHGVSAKLKKFSQAIGKAIRGMVTQPQEKGGALPPSILKHLRFGSHGGGGNPRFVSVTRPYARPEDGTWMFGARCRKVKEDGDPWQVTVQLKVCVDGGTADDLHAIAELSGTGAVGRDLQTGVLKFPGSVTSTVITGRLDPAKLPAVGLNAAVSLRIDGEGAKEHV